MNVYYKKRAKQLTQVIFNLSVENSRFKRKIEFESFLSGDKMSDKMSYIEIGVTKCRIF